MSLIKKYSAREIQNLEKRKLDALIAELYYNWKWVNNKKHSILVHPSLAEFLTKNENEWNLGINGELDLDTKNYKAINPFPCYDTINLLDNLLLKMSKISNFSIDFYNDTCRVVIYDKPLNDFEFVGSPLQVIKYVAIYLKLCLSRQSTIINEIKNILEKESDLEGPKANENYR